MKMNAKEFEKETWRVSMILVQWCIYHLLYRSFLYLGVILLSFYFISFFFCYFREFISVLSDGGLTWRSISLRTKASFIRPVVNTRSPTAKGSASGKIKCWLSRIENLKDRQLQARLSLTRQGLKSRREIFKVAAVML